MKDKPGGIGLIDNIGHHISQYILCHETYNCSVQCFVLDLITL